MEVNKNLSLKISLRAVFAVGAVADLGPFVEIVGVAVDGVVDLFDGWELCERFFDGAEVLAAAAAGGGGAHLGEQAFGEIDVGGAVLDVDALENAFGLAGRHAAVTIGFLVLGRTFE